MTASLNHWLTAGLALLLAQGVVAQQIDGGGSAPFTYLRLGKPQRILLNHQQWEEDQFPHTLSVVELHREGYQYWGWYGLNDGGGIGLARSNDLVHWVKYRKNPLLTNARWPSVLAQANPADPSMLYVAYTRDYDTPTSHIVLAATHDGKDLELVKILVYPVLNQRNQNPNLFRDPRTGRFYLTWYRGNGDEAEVEHSEIVSRNAENLEDLDLAPEKVLIAGDDTIAAPTLLYVEGASGPANETHGVYYLSTEIYPDQTEWQTKVFASTTLDGEFRPVQGNPVLRGGRACLFQYIFHGHYYGFLCHEEPREHWSLEVVQAPFDRSPDGKAR